MDAKSKLGQREGGRRKVVGIAMAAIICSLLLAALVWGTSRDKPRHSSEYDERRETASSLPPLLMPQDTKQISAEDALAENDRLPFSNAPVERAPPLVVPLIGEQIIGRRSSLDCLSAAIYYEAGQESETGKRAVAQVVLNRARHPAFPHSICDVVYQGSERRTGCQFTFTCDGSLLRPPSRAGWDAARRIALAALSGYVEPKVGMATHYHADYVVPYWASSLAKIAKIDHHIFYRWSGNWGRRAAFNQLVSQEQFLDDRPQIEALIALDTEPTISGPYPAPAARGPRLAADEAAGSLTGADVALLPRKGVTSSIIADEAPAKLAADSASGKLKVE